MKTYNMIAVFIFSFLSMSICSASEEEDWEYQEALKRSMNFIDFDDQENEFQLALLESLQIEEKIIQQNSIRSVKNLEIDDAIISKIIMMSGGLEIQNSFMYNSTQTKKPLPTVCHINYYNTDMCSGFPFIISGQMKNGDYLQIVCQMKPIPDPQEGGLLIRPHYALHKSDKSLNYNVSFTCYDNKEANRIVDQGAQNVNTHASGGEGSVASPNNMSTGIDLNTQFSLIKSTITGHNDFINGNMTLNTYHILLSDLSELYKITNQFWGEIDLNWLLPELQIHILQAGAFPESIERFFNNIDLDLKNCKKN